MSTAQIIILAILGAVFWFIAAMVVRYAPVVFDASIWTVALFAASFAAAWVFIKLLLLVARLPAQQSLPAAGVATITALFLDGLAMTWAPNLYGASTEIAVRGAAWILFGVGAVWLVAMVLQKRAVA